MRLIGMPKRQLQPAADAGALDDRQGRRRKVCDGFRGAVHDVGIVRRLRGIEALVGELRNVRSGSKGAAAPAQHQAAQPGLRRQVPGEVAEPTPHGEVEGVAARGPVQPQGRDRPVTFQFDRLTGLLVRHFRS
jgi:hypothetical protein